MPLSADRVNSLCQRLLGGDESDRGRALGDYLAAIPRLDSLADLPRGTRVLVRGDLDAKPGKAVGEGDVRLRSMAETLAFGRERGFVQIVYGHVGRDETASLEKVCKRLGEIVGSDVELVKGWFDQATDQVTDEAAQRIAGLEPGAIVMLENTRQFKVERVLWKAKPVECGGHAERLAKACQSVADKLGQVLVNEAFAAGSLDTFTVILPLAMQRVALGRYIAEQFEGPLQRCVKAQLVVFSGVKIDKLDDLEAIIGRGHVKKVIAAGSLAMALKKAASQLVGGDFCLGVAENTGHADKPYYIPPARVEQARRMLASAKEQGIEFVLPIDFILQDGRSSETIGKDDQQFDVGPKTSAFYAEHVGHFINWSKDQAMPAVAFHNGVFGMFEDPRFESGTREFIGQLRRMRDAGIEVYVGGGEGGTALGKYGQEDWVTHVFTAGGTVLNALGSEPVPYLVSLADAAKG